MTHVETAAIIVLVLIAATAAWAVLAFNRLVALRNEAAQAWSGVEVQLKRRADLLPNLAEVVAAYAGHEQAALERVTEARAATYASAGSIPAAAAADGLMQSAITGMLGLAEGHPDLQASESFRMLQRELADTEDRLAAARRYHNAVARRYNDVRQSLPTSLIAGRLGFARREYYRIEDDRERAVPAAQLHQE